MGRFTDEFERQSDTSKFSQLKLDELFASAEDKKNLQNVIAALKKAENDNVSVIKMQDLGEKGLEVLLKIAKKVLL